MATSPIPTSTSIDDCKLLELRKIYRPQGGLTPVEGMTDIPFQIARVYYLYDIPGGEARGGHAHVHLQQLIVSVMGSFDVILDDGSRRKTVTLNRAYQGLYVPRLIWRELVNFSSGGICLVLASLRFEEDDYLRDHDAFVRDRDQL
jgi:hypothetical protein